MSVDVTFQEHIPFFSLPSMSSGPVEDDDLLLCIVTSQISDLPPSPPKPPIWKVYSRRERLPPCPAQITSTPLDPTISDLDLPIVVRKGKR